MPFVKKLRRATRSCNNTPTTPAAKIVGGSSSETPVMVKRPVGRPPSRGRKSLTRLPGRVTATPKPSPTAETSTPPASTTPKRGRGRPPKVIKKEETETEDDEEEDDSEGKNKNDSKNDDMVDSSTRTGNEIRLRRRDKIKTTERYSPELNEPTRRTRGRGGGSSGGPINFPSTASAAPKYISFDSDEEMNTVGVKKRRIDVSSAKSEIKSYIVDVKKDEESNKMVIRLPDGSTYEYAATSSSIGSARKPQKTGFRQRASDEEMDEDYEDDGALEDETDEDFRPRSVPRRKKSASRATISKLDKNEANERASTITVTGNRFTRTNLMNRVRPPGESTPVPAKLIIQPKVTNPTDGSKITKITSPSTMGKTKVTFITTPKSVTLTAASTSFKQPPKRNYGSAAKFIDELPELSECTLEDNDPSLSKLPDKILFINSDLPLPFSLGIENEPRLYLFRQVITPVQPNYPCLLCSGAKFVFKEEKDLSVHYSTYHELTIDHTTAKFSEDIVYVCLPKPIITRIEEDDCEGIMLNAPCQYCGEQVKLMTMAEMKNHYSETHGKEVKLIEQEEILNMHKALYCSICEVQSNDFVSHHNHMKSEHKLHTYICKHCVFTTQDANRLKTHFRAKHMISNNRIQNVQCIYCSGLIYGIERMNKHIMVAHCVQTGANEWSCTACLQPCGKADELLSHSYRCPALTMGTTPKEIEETNVKIDSGEKVKTKCFLCDKVFDSAEMCNLHLSHVHTKWSTRSVIHDTFLMVKHPNGKTDLMPSTSTGEEVPPLKLLDLPPMKILDEIGCKKNYGHYCIKCENVIKIYPLYYLHMFNVHKMEKIFECKISSCKQTFKDAKSLEEHTKATKHPQMSVIEDPLGAIACHFCNLYFVDDKELQAHLLSEDHYNKINTLMDKSGNKPEPRNHKCKTCHTWFGLADSYIYHLETESHKHACSYCGLHFALPSSRRTHIQSHHSEKSDICEICNVKQGSKERLFAHLVEHNIVFECNKCMRKFYQREQLNAHMETHGDARDCPWEGCNRKVMRSNLTTHIRQHRIENESKCTICGKGFSSKQVLQTHMEIHAKAESNAKAILQAVPNHNQLKSSTGAGASSTHPGTTLISITTPPSNLTSIKQRSPIKGRGAKGPQNKATTLTTNRNSNGIPNALKIMCCSCNQSFNSHNELSNHKCVVPVVTITGTKPNSNEIQLDQATVNKMLSSPIVITQSDKFQLPSNPALVTSKDETTSDNLEEDPQKLVLDIAAQLAQTVQEEEAEKLKQKQLKKVEQLLHQQQSHTQVKQPELKRPSIALPSKQTTHVTSTSPVSQPAPGSMQSRARRTYSSIKSSSSQLNDNSVRQSTSTFGAENKIEEVKKSFKKDEIVINNNNSINISDAIKDENLANNMIEIPVIEGDAANPGDQYIVFQQSDGQYLQICVPEGMDIEEVVRSLSITLSESPDETQTGELVENSATNVDPSEQNMQEATDQNAASITAAEAGTVAVEGMDDQQVIYLPVSEDGTYAIDSAALAMLTGNGDTPIIVTSGN